MESFVHLRKGTTPGACTPTSTASRTTSSAAAASPAAPPTCTAATTRPRTAAVGPLRPVDVLSGELKPSDATDAAGGPLLMFSNADCQVLLSRRSEPMPFFVRYVDGDLLSFVHKGAGLLETEFGPLRYREGDWVYIPKACTFRQVPDDESTLLMIQATDEFRVPPPGHAGPALPVRPVAGRDSRAGAHRRRDGRDEYEVRLIHDGGPTSLFYQHHPLDVEGWRGDNFPFTFNIADYNVVTSDSVHLPPTVHLFMQATGVYVMNFLPKPAESVPGTERTPVVSPQRRLRRDRVLPRRIALRHPDAARADFACAARGSPRRTGEGAGAGAAQVRRVRQGRLVGHRHRHPAPAHPVGRSSGQRSGAALMTH